MGENPYLWNSLKGKIENFKKSDMKTLKSLLLVAVAAAAVACCGKNTKCSEKACADSTACCVEAKCPCDVAACVAAKSYEVYDPQSFNLKDMPLFFEADKAELTQVSPTVTRKMAYLNDLMICIVDIKGPQAKADPVHSHVAEQMSYIAEGDVIVTIGTESKQLKAGDIFCVPANVPHTVQALGPRLLLIDSFTPIRHDFIKK